MRLKLTREQRSALFAGQPIRLTFPGERSCPIEEGHVEVLSAHVRLEVTGIRRSKTGEHVLVYTLHNNRLGQRFLARHGDELGYSHSAASDVDAEAGEAVDEFTQKRITTAARARQLQASADVIAAAEGVMAAIKDRADQSPEFRREARLTMHRIRRELDRFIERQRRKAA